MKAPAAAWVLALALLGAPPLLADSVKDKIRQEEREKRELERKLRAERDRLKNLKRKDESVLTEIIRYNRKVNRARTNEKVSQRNLDKVRSRLSEIRGEVAASYDRVQERQQLLGQRLASIYKQGPMQPLTLLASAEDSSSFLTRYRLLRHLAAGDRRMIEETYEELEQISVYEKEFQAKEKDLEDQAQEVRQAKDKLLKAKREREKRLYAIRAEKKKKEALVAELKSQAAKMQALLGQLRADYERQKSGMPAKHPDRAGGRLGYIAWPLRGRIVSTYGKHKHPEFDTFIFNRGIEIGAGLGSSVASSQDGTVLFAGTFEGYGQMVVLDHGSNYMTVYGNLGDVEVGVGQRVARGQALGEVGSAGASKLSSLYFEVRQGGKPLNPLRFLRR